MKKKPVACFGYIRVSTKEQAEKGISLDGQSEAIRKKADELGMDLIRIYSDRGISGTTMEGRDNLHEVLRVLTKGECLIVYSISRLTRKVKDFTTITDELNQRGIRLISISDHIDTDAPYSKFMDMIKSMFAEMEADLIRERVNMGMEAKKNAGEHVGRIPYGWQLKDGKGSGLVEVDFEQGVILRVKKMVDDGHSYNEIAKVFMEEGIPPPGKSKKWFPMTVSRIYNRDDVKTKGRGDRQQQQQNK